MEVEIEYKGARELHTKITDHGRKSQLEAQLRNEIRGNQKSAGSSTITRYQKSGGKLYRKDDWIYRLLQEKRLEDWNSSPTNKIGRTDLQERKTIGSCLMPQGHESPTGTTGKARGLEFLAYYNQGNYKIVASRTRGGADNK